MLVIRHIVQTTLIGFPFTLAVWGCSDSSPGSSGGTAGTATGGESPSAGTGGVGANATGGISGGLAASAGQGPGGGAATGGGTESGGTSTSGGSSSGGGELGGAATGGDVGAGGTLTGGDVGSGGISTGGATTGGESPGGTSSGGVGAGGSPDGGAANGGLASGGLGAAAGAGGSSHHTEWPNPESQANSDPWLMEHHEQIETLRPRVLVLNFDNQRDEATAQTAIERIFAAFREASRPHGYDDPAAPPLLDYQLAKVVSLRDSEPSASPYPTSTAWPRGSGATDYAAFFAASFAPRYGYEDPDTPGSYLTLCDLVDRGFIHELWLYSDPGGGDANAAAAEVLEWSPNYDANDRRLDDAGDRCAGNGCFDAAVPHCRGSLRIAFVNSTRGPGCFLESISHGIESKLGWRPILPAVRAYFREFARFDLDQEYGLPFESWYALPMGPDPNPASPPSDCFYLDYPAPSEAAWYLEPWSGSCSGPPSRARIANYDPACGNVHFAPNARAHYDKWNAQTVETTCQGFRRGEDGGADRRRLFGIDAFTPYQTLADDCQGSWLVWWIQNMPGHGTPALADDGSPLRSWLPYLFY